MVTVGGSTAEGGLAGLEDLLVKGVAAELEGRAREGGDEEERHGRLAMTDDAKPRQST